MGTHHTTLHYTLHAKYTTKPHYTLPYTSPHYTTLHKLGHSPPKGYSFLLSPWVAVGYKYLHQRNRQFKQFDWLLPVPPSLPSPFLPPKLGVILNMMKTWTWHQAINCFGLHWFCFVPPARCLVWVDLLGKTNVKVTYANTECLEQRLAPRYTGARAGREHFVSPFC